MKKLILFTLCFVSLRVWAQQIDEQRMNRDLEVAKNILNTLISDNNNNMFFMNNSIDATYLPGYGVTFTIPDNMFWRFNIMNKKFMIARPGAYSYSYEYKSPDSGDVPTPPTAGIDSGNQSQSSVDVYVTPDKEVSKSKDNNGDIDKSEEEYEAHLKNSIMTFFSDYADLISQLGPDSRIRVVQKASPDFKMTFAFAGDSGENSSQNNADGFSAEVYKKDISAYREGKINLDEFKKRVTFTDMNKETHVPDLDLFSKILKSYFSPDVSQTYFVDNTPSYERIKDYGVIYSVQTFSSYEDNDVFKMPSTPGQTLNEQDRNKKVVALYPKFEEDVKNFIVDYGRAIHSLGDNEMLVIKIKLTRCDQCSMPKSIEVSVNASVLSQYEQQKITRDTALAAITIKRDDQ